MDLGQPGGGERRKPLSIIFTVWRMKEGGREGCTALHILFEYYITCGFVYPSKGLCPMLQISNITAP